MDCPGGSCAHAATENAETKARPTNVAHDFIVASLDMKL
jgi:hypothetical protein